MSIRGVAIAATACLAAVACGSTVQVTSEGPAGPGVDPFAASTAPTKAGPAPGAHPGDAVATGSSRAGTQPSGSVTAVDSGDRAATGTRGPVLGRGATATSVRIGFQYVDTSGGTAILGKNLSTGDPTAQARAVQRWINAHGGLGGRTLELDTYGVPYDDYITDGAAADARVCTHFTEDVKVLAVAVYVPSRPLMSCLAKKDTISVAEGYPLDRAAFDQLGRWYYSPGSMSQDRGAEAMVAGLAGSFLTRTSKIGLIRFDEPTYAAAEPSLRAALAAHGLSLADTVTVSYYDQAQQATDSSAAVLRFRQRGITHVVFLDNQGGAGFLFMQAAESQGYRPKYALSTNNSPGGLVALAPAAQLRNARAVSWAVGDTDVPQQSPPAIPGSIASCLRIMRAAGISPSSDTERGSALVTCAQLLFIKAVLDKAAAPNSSAFQSAVDGLRYADPLTYSVRLGPGRHDGAATTRLIAFDSGCTCWKYQGPGPAA